MDLNPQSLVLKTPFPNSKSSIGNFKNWVIFTFSSLDCTVQKHCVYIKQMAVHTEQMNWICRPGRYLMLLVTVLTKLQAKFHFVGMTEDIYFFLLAFVIKGKLFPVVIIWYTHSLSIFWTYQRTSNNKIKTIKKKLSKNYKKISRVNYILDQYMWYFK